MHSGTGRVYYHHVGTAMLRDETVGKDILHVAGIEKCIVDTVHSRINFRIGNSLLHVFYAYHLPCSAGYEICDGPRTGVQVVHKRKCLTAASIFQIRLKSGKSTCHLVEIIRLARIGLIE